MILGPAGEALIKSYEKLAFTAYLDEGGVPTIAWGHTGPEVELGLVWTLDQCQAAFASDTRHAVGAVNGGTNAPITQNQFDALVSFAYNVGIGAFHDSTLRKLQNAQDIAGCAGQFQLWINVKGKPSDGLKARRAAELALFLTP